jgi:hypothetical protein
MPNATEQNSNIEQDLAELSQSSIRQLRQCWRAVFRTEPPPAFGPDLLRRSIAQKLQDDAYGGLDRLTAQLLNQLIVQSAKSRGKIVVPRRIKPGAVLVRDWKGKVTCVYRSIFRQLRRTRIGLSAASYSGLPFASRPILWRNNYAEEACVIRLYLRDG